MKFIKNPFQINRHAHGSFLVFSVLTLVFSLNPIYAMNKHGIAEILPQPLAPSLPTVKGSH